MLTGLLDKPTLDQSPKSGQEQWDKEVNLRLAAPEKLPIGSGNPIEDRLDQTFSWGQARKG